MREEERKKEGKIHRHNSCDVGSERRVGEGFFQQSTLKCPFISKELSEMHSDEGEIHATSQREICNAEFGVRGVDGDDCTVVQS